MPRPLPFEQDSSDGEDEEFIPKSEEDEDIDYRVAPTRVSKQVPTAGDSLFEEDQNYWNRFQRDSPPALYFDDHDVDDSLFVPETNEEIIDSNFSQPSLSSKTANFGEIAGDSSHHIGLSANGLRDKHFRPSRPITFSSSIAPMQDFDKIRDNPYTASLFRSPPVHQRKLVRKQQTAGNRGKTTSKDNVKTKEQKSENGSHTARLISAAYPDSDEEIGVCVAKSKAALVDLITSLEGRAAATKETAAKLQVDTNSKALMVTDRQIGREQKGLLKELKNSENEEIALALINQWEKDLHKEMVLKKHMMYQKLREALEKQLEKISGTNARS